MPARLSSRSRDRDAAQDLRSPACQAGRSGGLDGVDPIPNELPQDPEPDSQEVILRRHLSHLRIGGTVLDAEYVLRRSLAEFIAFDSVPLEVEELDRYAPLQNCVPCGGSKGERYTICTGCWTTQIRFSELMLSILPNVDERQLVGLNLNR